jgi:hypothetical protein
MGTSSRVAPVIAIIPQAVYGHPSGDAGAAATRVHAARGSG